MNPARSYDDALLDRLRAGRDSDLAADPRLALVRALVRAASEPPPPDVERRHLAAISNAVRAVGHADPRAASNGRPTVGETLPHRVRGTRLARPLKAVALVVATALALTGVAFASGGLPEPLRAALEKVGLMPQETGDDSRVAPRLPAGTASRRGPQSRCGPAGAPPRAKRAWCRPPRGGAKRARARRSEGEGRPLGRRPGVRGQHGTRGSAASRAESARARPEAGSSAPGRSGSSPSRRGSAPVGGGRGRSSGGGPGGSGRGRSSSITRGQGQSRSRRPAIRERASAGARHRVGRAEEALSSP